MRESEMPLKQRIKNIVRLSAPLFIAKSSMTEDTAVSILHSYSPDPSTTCVANNALNPQYDLQIIVTAYNVDKYVAECLESILNQKTHYSYLVTVVNDGSTDKTPEILRSYQTKYPERMEVINQENRGFSGARNAALKVLKGRYITFLDSDDVMPESAIEALLEKADGKDIIQGGWYTFEHLGGGRRRKFINSRVILGESFLRLKLWSIFSSRKDIGSRILQFLSYCMEQDTVRRSLQMWFMATD
ncbi:MAG: glycosyltransferase family A protein [Lachnospiraceae bacterium]|nr:glycosyltransferase family A protein [Lachnospiraceae bacterium]